MMSAAKPPSTALGRWYAAAVVLVVALAAVARFWAAWFDHGVFWPDEIFQSLEQAHRLAFGYGIVPWEFRRGARSWVFPGMLAGLLQIGAALGLDSGRSLVLLVKSCMAALSVTGVYLSMRLARHLAGPVAAIVAGLLSGFFSAGILLGSRTLAETVSAPALIGLVLLARREGRNIQLAAGALAGLSIYLRYQNGLVAVGVLGILVLDRRFRDAAYYAAASGVVGLLGGVLDWITWGKPFAAFKMYFWFNLFKSAGKFGAYPFPYYAEVAWQIAGPAILVIVAGLLFSVRLAPKLFLLVAAFILIHSVVPHKEFRFLMPVMPIALAISGAGLASALARVRHGSALALVLATSSAAYMAFVTPQLTWAKMGFPSDRGHRSPWHSGEGINRLLWSVGEREDVCGVIVSGESFGWIGGYSYLHRDVNLFPGDDVGEAKRAAANYWIQEVAEPPPNGYQVVANSREFVLLRREGACAPPPADYRRELPY